MSLPENKPIPESCRKLVNSIATNCLSVRMRLLNRMVGAIYESALQPHGIKASQLNILVAVAAFGRVTSKQLCRALHMDPSTFSRSAARLKMKGWLQTMPSGEGRILNIAVTKQGFKKIEAVYPAWQKAQAEVSDLLGTPTLETLTAAGNKQLLGGLTR